MIGCEDGKWGEGLVWEEGQQWSELAVTCNTGGTHCNTVTRVATVKHCETHDMIMYAAANKAGYNVDDVVQYVWSCIYEQSIAGTVCKAAGRCSDGQKYKFEFSFPHLEEKEVAARKLFDE